MAAIKFIAIFLLLVIANMYFIISYKLPYIHPDYMNLKVFIIVGLVLAVCTNYIYFKNIFKRFSVNIKYEKYQALGRWNCKTEFLTYIYPSLVVFIFLSPLYYLPAMPTAIFAKEKVDEEVRVIEAHCYYKSSNYTPGTEMTYISMVTGEKQLVRFHPVICNESPAFKDVVGHKLLLHKKKWLFGEVIYGFHYL